MKRDTALYGDDGVLYNYGKGYDDEKAPKSWKEIPELIEIKDMIEKFTNAKFDICLCGWYSNGSKSIGFHCDREELGKKV